MSADTGVLHIFTAEIDGNVFEVTIMEDGGLVAETIIEYMRYRSDIIPCDFLDDISSETFIWLHQHNPPIIRIDNDIITISYTLQRPLMATTESLTFKLKKQVPKDYCDVLEMYNAMMSEILSLRKTYSQDKCDNRTILVHLHSL